MDKKQNPNNPRIVKTPKQNEAERELLIIEEAVTKIKEIIASDIQNKVSNEETSKKVDNIIASTVRQFTDPKLRVDVRNSLINSAKSWYYTHSQHMRTLESDMQRKLEASGFGGLANQLKVSGYGQLKEQVTPATFVQWDTEAKIRGFKTDAKVGIQIIDDYQKSVKQELKALSADPPVSSRITKDNRPYKINLRNLAEMKVRHEANIKDVDRLKADGVDLVWTSSHINASDRCAPYQGRLYSLGGKTDVTSDGIPYTPYDEAADGPYGDGNGIINGYNCRHYLIEYFEGSAPPREWDTETIKRERAIDTRQRQYENTIRNLKTQEALFRVRGEDKEASRLRKRWQALTDDYKRFSNSNGRPFYLWRTALSKDELYAPVKLPDGYFEKLDALHKRQDEYNKGDEEVLKSTYEFSVNSGNISALVRFEDYKQMHEQIRTEIVGKNTFDGIEIRSQSIHFIERVFGTSKDPKTGYRREGVELDLIKDTLFSKDSKIFKEIDVQSYEKSCSVTLNTKTGNLIQVNRISKKRRGKNNV